eukprot:m.12498 g.12498  ORF g.12498 m.12498 type:complete len:287 (+) comp4004_c0_seq1:166-1026(+)
MSFDAEDVGVRLDYYGDLKFFVECFVGLFLIDLFLVRVLRWFPEKSSATRYFSIHVLVNAYVVAVHFKDVIGAYTTFQNAYLGPTDTRGSIAIFSLHLYHIVFFQPLDTVDWIHHIVMVVVMLPLGYLLAPGYMLGHGCFYASGLPGGIDYLLLVLVKCNVISKMQEKTWNVWIQNWLRSPGCLIQAWLTYQNYTTAVARIADPSLPNRLPTSTRPVIDASIYAPTLGLLNSCVVFLSFYWNGQYFLERVIRSHERHVVLHDTLKVLGVSMDDFRKKKQAQSKKSE